MPRKLKAFQTSVGFFDLAVAAPSMKAAAEAWGSDPDIFRQGFARETDDPLVVEATMAAPGVVLRRPVGSQEMFSQNASFPKLPAEPKAAGREAAMQRPPNAKRDLKQKAEEKQQERAHKEAEAERQRAREQREQRIAKADAALERARKRHLEAVRLIEQRRAELAKDEHRENERWQQEQQAHVEALKAIGT